jgi:tetratricopeptide (TPR) repeat protein
VEQIQALLKSDPDDVFLNFSLAMEWSSAGQFDAALKQFDRVLELDGDYVTAYFRKGDVLARMERTEDARTVLQAGIEAAGRVGDQHLQMKITERLNQLG